VNVVGVPSDWVGNPEKINTGVILNLVNVLKSFSIRCEMDCGTPPVAWTNGSFESEWLSSWLIYSLASTPSRAPDKAERGAVWERLRSATYSRGQCDALLDFKGWTKWTKWDLRSKPPIPILCSLLSFGQYLYLTVSYSR
jgi:hypothetical protein